MFQRISKLQSQTVDTEISVTKNWREIIGLAGIIYSDFYLPHSLILTQPDIDEIMKFLGKQRVNRICEIDYFKNP